MAQRHSKPPLAFDLTTRRAPREPTPRLGIIHLLGWITVSAVLIGLVEDSLVRSARGRTSGSVTNAHPQPLADEHFPMLPILGKVLLYIELAMVAAAVIAACAVVRAKRTVLFDDAAPGHWLAIAVSFACIELVLLGCAVAGASPMWFDFFVFLCLAVVVATVFLAWFVLAYHFRDQPAWAICFAASGFVFLGPPLIVLIVNGRECLEDCLVSPARLLVAPSITGALILIAATIDFVRGEQRDWAHWVGVAVAVLQPVLFCIAAVALG